jgi:hypothetical protein
MIRLVTLRSFQHLRRPRIMSDADLVACEERILVVVALLVADHTFLWRLDLIRMSLEL